MPASDLENALWEQITGDTGLPWPQREVRFHPKRKWRFDFGFEHLKLAVECEGGTWVRGAHSRGKHFESDCIKYAEAAILGWRVIRVTTDMISDGRALALIQRALSREENTDEPER